jgi:hypothetical protein
MNKLKKIRGHRRIKRKIEKWRTDYISSSIELLSEKHYDYVKVWVSPFDNLRYKERDYTGPKAENRTLILKSLFEIYDNWDEKLKELNIPYYLKIWLYEPRITSSQVVCGIEEKIEHYDNVFSIDLAEKHFPMDRYMTLKERIDKFEWTLAIDEEIIENDFWPKEQYLNDSDYFSRQRLYRKLEKLNYKKHDLTHSEEKLIRYFVPKGNIWIGNKK